MRCYFGDLHILFGVTRAGDARHLHRVFCGILSAFFGLSVAVNVDTPGSSPSRGVSRLISVPRSQRGWKPRQEKQPLLKSQIVEESRRGTRSQRAEKSLVCCQRVTRILFGIKSHFYVVYNSLLLCVGCLGVIHHRVDVGRLVRAVFQFRRA